MFGFASFGIGRDSGARRRGRLLVLVLVCACGSSAQDDAGSDAEPDETTSTLSGSTRTSTSTRGDDDGSTGETTDATEGESDASSFLQSVDGGTPPFPCSPWQHGSGDCGAGFKCAPWAYDGSESWNETKCVPINPDPDPVGAPCTVERGPTSGLDSCEAGALCWRVDPETLLGECVGFCGGTEASPQCPEGHTCGVFNAGVLVLCLPSCDPLSDDCDEGFACRPRSSLHPSSDFLCIPIDAGGKLHLGCEEQGGCPAGSVCVPDETCPNGCCAPYCDSTDPVADEACDAEGEGTICVSIYAEGAAPEGLEHVGICWPE
jgi:hypothetical protein